MATTTIKESGGDHSTIAAWEAATDNDLVTAEEGEIGHLYKRTSGPNNPWTEQVTFLSAAGYTNATFFRKLMTPPGERHSGDFAHDGAHLNPTGTGHIFTLSEDYFQVEGLDFHDWTGNSAEACRINGTFVWISKCVFSDADVDVHCDAIYLGSSNKTLYVSNCIFWNVRRVAVMVAQGGTTSFINNTGYIYYCSAYELQNSLGTDYGVFGMDYGRTNGTTVFYAKNCVAFTRGTSGNSRCYTCSDEIATEGYLSYCVAEDLSITDNACTDVEGNTESAVAADEFTFIDGILSAPDLTPKALSTLLYGGTSLSADAFLIVTDDILGNARSATTPCIGAIEVAAAGGATPKGVLGLALDGPLRRAIY